METPADSALDVACALISDGFGRFFACRRAAHMRDAGVWEFPGGKIEAGESPSECVRRELREELAVEATAEAPVVTVEAKVSGRRLRLHACPATLSAAPKGSTDHDRLAYLSLDDFLRVPVTPAEAALLDRLRSSANRLEP